MPRHEIIYVNNYQIIVKGKVFLLLNEFKHYDMKAYGEWMCKSTFS
jgi:hypothetical protein